jgi:LysR family hydrogen peroxide-inducible transcriptional activator
VVRFTPLGERIVERAHRVLREAEELAELAAAAGTPLAGELRMSVIPTIAPFLLPDLLPRLRAEKPDLKLFLREETSQAACDNLHHGLVDCVLLAQPFPCGDVDFAPLFEDRIMLAVPESLESSLSGLVPPDEIDPTQLLMLEDGHCLKDHALAACNRPDLRLSARMMGTSLHTLVQMVDNGLGMTMIPEMAVKSGILDGTQVHAHPLKSDHDSRTIALVWRRNSPREKEFQLLADILRQYTPA